MSRVDAQSIAQWRMRRQNVWGPPLRDPDAVFGWLGAIQSQEFPVAKWSIGQRLRGCTNADLDDAFNRGVFLRTHVLRPTWHFVSPRDIRWMLKLTGPRVLAQTASRHRTLDITPRLMSRVHRIFSRALSGGEHLTRRQLAELLHKNKIPTEVQRLAHIVSAAELVGLICSGPMEGKNHTYALLDDRVREEVTLEGDDALAELTRRYFVSRGPATAKDFSWWSGLKMGDVRRGLEIVADELHQLVVADRTYWYVGRASRGRLTRIDLVQPYEEVLISYSESRDAMLGRHGRRATATERPPFMNTILLDAQVIGHWRPRVVRDELTIDAYFHRSLRPFEREAMDAAVERYGRFVGLPSSWKVTKSAG